jgi:hypothetical protein
MARRHTFLGLLLFAGCAHAPARDEAQRRALAAIDPASEPAPPREPGKEWHEELNTEFYLGSRDEEQARFAQFVAQINGLQERASKQRGQPIQRGFHAKAHGCLRGELRLRPDRDPRTRFGVFAADRPWPLWARFSNGVGWQQGDKELDARGLALKLMGVPGKKYSDDEKLTQDFLMTNSPTPVGRNAEEFMRFAHANAKGRAAGVGFLLSHPISAGPALLRTNPIDSMVTVQYWSGGAYHLGAHQTVKFTAKPCADTKPRKPSRKSPAYLRTDLSAAARDGVCMTLYVQFQADSERTPIENASKEWKESIAPLVPVGDVVLPPQSIDGPEAEQFCRDLSFNPWHSIAAHKPMGHINRARYYVYAASRAFRHGGGEPTAPTVTR